jgi:lantibiotic biosynthesis protein
MKQKSHIISEIESSIHTNSNIFTSMGVSNGLAGASLFHYFRYMQTEDPKHHDLLFSYLEKSIEGLNQDYQGNTLIQDIIEIGVLIKLYQNRQLVDDEVFEMYDEHFNSILETILHENIAHKNISPVTGALLIAKYFLKVNDDYSKIKPVTELISDTAISDKDSDGIYWISAIARENKNYVEFGITHGVAGITNFLLAIATTYQLDTEEKDKIDNLILKSLNFLLYHLNDTNERGFFPFGINYSETNDETLNLAYGDLGILHVIWKSAQYLKKDDTAKTAENYLKKISALKEIENIRDANILYGTSGFSSFFHLFHSHLTENDFKDHWNNKTISYSNNENQWAGFDAHFNKFDVNTQLSLTNGIIGIGITLMQEELNKESNLINYLNFINYN